MQHRCFIFEWGWSSESKQTVNGELIVCEGQIFANDAFWHLMEVRVTNDQRFWVDKAASHQPLQTCVKSNGAHWELRPEVSYSSKESVNVLVNISDGSLQTGMRNASCSVINVCSPLWSQCSPFKMASAWAISSSSQDLSDLTHRITWCKWEKVVWGTGGLEMSWKFCISVLSWSDPQIPSTWWWYSKHCPKNNKHNSLCIWGSYHTSLIL